MFGTWGRVENGDLLVSNKLLSECHSSWDDQDRK